MKNILLFLFGLFCGVQSFAQDPDLYQNWYLISYEYDLGPIFFVNDIQPLISPTITIDQNLDYMGVAACNDYFGNFSYDSSNDSLVLESFDATLNICDEQSHDSFETDYFGYFGNFPVPVMYYLSSDSSGNMFLSLEFNAGFILNYQNFQLSISEENSVAFDIYPNPVSNQLIISSESLHTESITIYSISGQRILSEKNNTNTVDVSELSKGIYFLELITLEGKSVQNFIKN